jgi:hypothetical protein
MKMPVNMTAAIQPRVNVKPKINPSEMLCQTRDAVDAMRFRPFCGV